MEMFNLYVDLTHINTQCVLIFLYMVYNVSGLFSNRTYRG